MPSSKPAPKTDRRLTRREAGTLALAAGALGLVAGPLARRAAAAERTVEEMMSERILGDPSAPLTILEFSSLTCPHCRAFHQDTLPQLKETYIDTGKVKLIYKDFPLNGPAAAGTMLARCAPDERFFPLIETLFDKQPQWSASEDVLGALAQLGRFAGMSGNRIEACFNNKALFEAIREARDSYSAEYEISSTPTFVIGEETIVGAQPFETFAEAIDGQLS